MPSQITAIIAMEKPIITKIPTMNFVLSVAIVQKLPNGWMLALGGQIAGLAGGNDFLRCFIDHQDTI